MVSVALCCNFFSHMHDPSKSWCVARYCIAFPNRNNSLGLRSEVNDTPYMVFWFARKFQTFACLGVASHALYVLKLRRLFLVCSWFGISWQSSCERPRLLRDRTRLLRPTLRFHVILDTFPNSFHHLPVPPTSTRGSLIRVFVKCNRQYPSPPALDRLG